MNLKMVFIDNRWLLIGAMGLFSVFLLSCQEDLEYKNPIVDEATMVDVLKDIHLAEAWLATMQNYPEAKRDSIAQVQYATIFKLHKVTAKDYEQSMQAYMGNPKAISELYDKVLEKLNKEEVKATHPDAKSKDSKPNKDSVSVKKDTIRRIKGNPLLPNQLGKIPKQK